MKRISAEFGSPNQKWSAISIWAAIHLVLLFLFFRLDLFSKLPLVKEDVGLYRHYADQIMAGHLPYKDFVPEYPPLALAVFVVPKLFTHTEAGYTAAFFLLTLAFEFLSLMVIIGMETSKLGKTVLHLSPRQSSSFFFLYLLAIGHLVYFRFDIVVSFFVLLAVYFAVQNRGILSWAFLAIAVGIKGFALFLVPLFMIYNYFKSNSQWKREAAISFGGTSLLIWGPFLLTNYQGIVNSLVLHAARGIEIGSTYASVLLVGRLAGLPVKTVFGQNSIEVVFPGSTSVALSSFAALVLLSVFLYIRFFGAVKSGENTREANLVRYATLSILGFMLTFKVFSPQFMVWVAASAPLLSWRSVRGTLLFRSLLLIAAALTQVVVLNFSKLAAFSRFFLALQVLRNGLLMALFLAVLFLASRRKENSPLLFPRGEKALP